jgi:hypothetical protein
MGPFKEPIDFMNKPNAIVRTASGGPMTMVLLNWFNFNHEVISNSNMAQLILIG